MKPTTTKKSAPKALRLSKHTLKNLTVRTGVQAGKFPTGGCSAIAAC